MAAPAKPAPTQLPAGKPTAAVGLRLAPGLVLPTTVFTQVVALLAKRGAGKTHTAAVLVEEMVAAGGQVVILDPVGAWWGLRAGADSTNPGLPFVVLGGDHGDLPLDPNSGTAIADLAVAEQVLLVVDMSAFDSKAEQNRFVLAFMTRLYHRNREPLHLVLEEADEFAPERNLPGDAPMLGAVQRVVRRGRSRGIGVTLISQRSASISKGVLTQADVLIALRTTAPHDQKAIGEWIQAKGADEKRDEVLGSLSKLPTGSAWVWAPELDTLKKVHIRARRTFDSSASPQLGKTVVQPKVFAAVDLAVLRERLKQPVTDPAVPAGGPASAADTAELAKLREQNQVLTGQLTRTRAELTAVQNAPPVIQQVPVVDQHLRDAVAAAAEDLAKIGQRLRDALDASPLVADPPVERAAPQRPDRAAPNLPPATAPTNTAPVPTSPVPTPAGRTPSTGTALPKAQRSILAALAPYHPRSRSKTQIALLAQYSSRGGGFNNALSALRTAGFIDGGGDAIAVTDAGLAALGAYEPLPTGDALRQHWLGQLPKAPRLILDALIAAWPAALSKQQVAEAAGYEPAGGGFNNALSRLRTLELITGSAANLQASPDLF